MAHHLTKLRELIYDENPDLDLIANLACQGGRASRAYVLEHFEGAHSDYPESALWRVLLNDNQIQGELVRGILHTSRGRPLWFNGVNLRGINWSKTDFRTVHFTGTDLRNANLESCEFHACSICETNMKGVRFAGSTFDGDLLNEVDLEGADMRGSRIAWNPLRGNTTVKHSNFKNVNLRESAIREIGIWGCSFENTDFRGATITDVIFSATNLSGANFEGATFEDVKLCACAWDENTVWPRGYESILRSM